MIIGNFTTAKEQGNLITGRIWGVALDIPTAVFKPAPTKTGNSPDFVVYGGPHQEAEAAHWELGVAWRKTSKAGKPYLSVKLDGPMLANPINCALIQQQDGSHTLVWNRREVADEEQAAA